MYGVFYLVTFNQRYRHYSEAELFGELLRTLTKFGYMIFETVSIATTEHFASS